VGAFRILRARILLCYSAMPVPPFLVRTALVAVHYGFFACVHCIELKLGSKRITRRLSRRRASSWMKLLCCSGSAASR
jgi:hypothetical protein